MIARHIGINGLLLIFFIVLLGLALSDHIEGLLGKFFKGNKKLAGIVSICIIVLMAKWIVAIIGEPIIHFLEAITGWTFRR